MSAPDPLVPAEVDLQDFPFMPLHVARLRDSDFNVKVGDAEFRCAIMLWCASWHQLPAGSLPDDDATLAHLAGLGRDQRTWKRVRAGSLYGFVKCSDGRLYHRIIAEQVVDAWDSKLRQRHRTYCAAIRKHNSRHADDQREAPDFETWSSQGQPSSVTRDTPPVSRVTPPENERDIGSKRQGQGQGQGQLIEEPDGSSTLPPKRAHRLPDDFEPVLTEAARRDVETLGPQRYADELRQFRDHHTAKGTTMKDWQAAFRTWLANAVKWTRQRNGSGNHASRDNRTADQRAIDRRLGVGGDEHPTRSTG